MIGGSYRQERQETTRGECPNRIEKVGLTDEGIGTYQFCCLYSNKCVGELNCKRYLENEIRNRK